MHDHLVLTFLRPMSSLHSGRLILLHLLTAGSILLLSWPNYLSYLIIYEGHFNFVSNPLSNSIQSRKASHPLKYPILCYQQLLNRGRLHWLALRAIQQC